MGARRADRGARIHRLGAPAALALFLSASVLAAPAGAEPEDVETAIEIAAPVELVWRVLTDFGSWPRFVPGLKRIAVLDRADREIALRHETERIGVAIDFTAVTVAHPELHRLDLELDASAANDIAAMHASWQLTPLASGRVRVQFRSAIDSGRPVPRFIERRVLRDLVVETVERFGSEVERRLEERRATRADGTQDV